MGNIARVKEKRARFRKRREEHEKALKHQAIMRLPSGPKLNKAHPIDFFKPGVLTNESQSRAIAALVVSQLKPIIAEQVTNAVRQAMGS
jgi:hypothetical protein